EQSNVVGGSGQGLSLFTRQLDLNLRLNELSEVFLALVLGNHVAQKRQGAQLRDFTLNPAYGRQCVLDQFIARARVRIRSGRLDRIRRRYRSDYQQKNQIEACRGLERF